MLVHDELYDPVKRTKDMKESEFTKYVKIRDAQKKNQPTDSKKVEKIRDIFYSTHQSIDKENLDKLWEFVGPKIEQNAGLAEFTIDYGGAESDFFFPWLVSVYTSPSEALEMSYGAGNDLTGKWVMSVPEDDKIDTFVRNDPTFVYNRERQLFVADLVTSFQDRSSKERKTKIVDIGAGRMAWARWHGFQFKPEIQSIYAADRDVTIDVKKLFNQNISELGLEYETLDMAEQLRSPKCRDADLIMLGGVATYYPMELFASTVIAPIYQLLKTGGVLYFDLQINCPYLLRSMKIFDWPPMKLKDNIAAAIDVVEKVRKKLWSEGMKFGAEYTLDTYNEVPTATMITFTKL